MLKELMNHLGYAFWAESALVIFLGVFVAVTVRAIRSDRREMQSHAEIVLNDPIRRTSHES
jgi:cbb3-type cytochrome oxidase subunit 3